jgi:hypothetical protein
MIKIFRRTNSSFTKILLKFFEQKKNLSKKVAKLKNLVESKVIFNILFFPIFHTFLHELNNYFNELMFTYSLDKNYFNYFYRINLLNKNK